MRVDAHSLPFAKEFFDAVVAIDVAPSQSSEFKVPEQHH
jgi:hypothetical protein